MSIFHHLATRLSFALALGLALWIAPHAARAQFCGGPGFDSRLTAGELAALDARVDATPFPRGLLWEARRGDRVLQIIGTMHLADPRHAALSARMEPLIAAADLMLLEMTREDMTRMERMMLTDPARVYLTDGPSLIDRLPPEDWARIADAARARDIPPFMAAKLRPWFLTLTLSMPPCILPALASGGAGLDESLMDLADAAGVRIAALEPWDTLFRAIDEASDDEQLDLLRATLLPGDIQTEIVVSMFDDYFAGEVARIWEMSRLSLDHLPGFEPGAAADLFELTERVLLTDRNRAWIPVIEAAASEHDRIVVAFGAAHLPGQAGVLNLLAEAGWTITPLP